MVLSALVLAAAIHASPPLVVEPPRARRFESVYGWTEAPAAEAVRPPIAHPPRARRVKTTKVYAWRTGLPSPLVRPRSCSEPGLQFAHNPDASVRAKVQSLGDMPKANHTLAVLRMADGCPVSSTIRFDVGR